MMQHSNTGYYNPTSIHHLPILFDDSYLGNQEQLDKERKEKEDMLKRIEDLEKRVQELETDKDEDIKKRWNFIPEV